MTVHVGRGGVAATPRGMPDGGAPFFRDFRVWFEFPGYTASVVDSPMAALATRR